MGATLVTRASSLVPTAHALGDAELVLVYISASWCGPCRAFTPKLNARYKARGSGRRFEVVFASLDRDAASFGAYFSGMAWDAAVAYGSGEALASRFGVSSVPTLLVFTRDGSLVSSAGVAGLTREAAGGPALPWVWGGELIGRTVTLQGLEKAAHLNGSRALVVGAVEASARLSVRVGGSGETIAVRREHAVVCEPWGSELIGKRITLKGLVGAAHRNGSAAVVVGAVEASARFTVKVEKDDAVVAVKRENMEVGEE